MTTRILLAAFLTLAGCSSADPSPTGDGHGGLVDVDAAAIPSDPGPSPSNPRDGGAPPRDAAPSTQQRCTGIATTCGALDTSRCAKALGCNVEQKCDGISTGCYSLTYNQYACRDQRGCYWDDTGRYCGGSSWSCDLISAAYCSLQRGCSAVDVCSGTVTACDLVPVRDCTTQPGCRLETK